MPTEEPSGLETVEVGTEDAYQAYCDNITKLNDAWNYATRALMGYNGAQYDVVRLGSDGKFYKAQATSDLSKMPAVGILLENKPNGEYNKAVFWGLIADVLWAYTPGEVLYLSPVLGEWQRTALDERVVEPFTPGQVLGFVLTATSIFVTVRKPNALYGTVAKTLAFDATPLNPTGYGDRGLLTVESVDGTKQLVYYDNGGKRSVITGGQGLGIYVKHEGDYAWLEDVNHIIFGCGTLTDLGGGTVRYTPPLADEGTVLGSVAYFDGSKWVELIPGIEGEALTTHAAGVPPTWEPAGGIGAGVGIGDLLYWNGAAWLPVLAGSAGKVLTGAGAAIPTWETPAAGDPEVFTKRIIQAIPNYGNTTVYQSGQGAHTTAGTVSSADDADGLLHNLATTAVANNQAYLMQSTYSRRDHEETLVVRIKTAASIAVMRLWGAGWASNWITAGGADAPNIHIAAFRFSTNAGDTNWMAVTGGAGGLGCTVTDTGVAVAANTVYTFRIVFSSTVPDVKFYINDTLVATHTTKLPTTTELIAYGISVTTLETVIKSFKWSRIARIGK